MWASDHFRENIVELVDLWIEACGYLRYRGMSRTKILKWRTARSRGVVPNFWRHLLKEEVRGYVWSADLELFLWDVDSLWLASILNEGCCFA